jgi:glycosyltransferase involved in cell wall biosynthesis
VSVILPTFNRAKYLREAIDSVLAQTHTDWELVVADDGSEGETRTFLASITDPRVCIEWLPHSGNPSAVRNKAIARARGHYIAFLDSDDVWAPRRLESHLSFMRSHPNRRWSYVNFRMIDQSGNPISGLNADWVPYEGVIVEPLLNLLATVPPATVIAERSLVEEAGGFDEDQLYAEHYELWIRLALLSEVSVSVEPLVSIRTYHMDRYTADRIADYEGWLQFYEKMGAYLSAPSLRSLCERRRRETVLFLAGLYGNRGDFASLLGTLLAGSTYSWPYPKWWWAAAKVMGRQLVPDRVRARYRQFGKKAAR